MKKKIRLLIIAILVIILCCGCDSDTPDTQKEVIDIGSSVSDISVPVKDEEQADDTSKNSVSPKEDKSVSEKRKDEESDTSASKIKKDEESDISASNNNGGDETDNQDNKESIEESIEGTPYENHGALSVKGTKLTDKNGNAFQIKGVSTHGIGWYPQYINEAAFKTLRDEWGVNCIRIAMYTSEYNGYCSDGDKKSLRELVNNGVAYATNLGMYVIIDWHILADNNPNTHKNEAIDFFKEMSAKYKDYGNVLYEICNEPNGGTSWSEIKSYAEGIIPIIKENNKDAVIIVGTPTWSQDVDKASENPITGYTNIMYTLHFYADTHRESLRNKCKTAINNGIPIFVTEFGTCDASGNGAVNKGEADAWIKYLNDNSISYCIWALSNKAETCSLIKESCDKLSGWTRDDLSEQGKWYVDILGGKAVGSRDNTADNQGLDENKGSDQTEDDNTKNKDFENSTAEAKSGSLKSSINKTGSWNDGKNDFYQYTVTLEAKDGDVSDWKLSVEFSTSVSIDQSWNANYEVNSSVINITPVDFNKSIKKGEKAEIGFIIKCSNDPGTPGIKIN